MVMFELVSEEGMCGLAKDSALISSRDAGLLEPPESLLSDSTVDTRHSGRLDAGPHTPTALGCPLGHSVASKRYTSLL